MSPFSRRSIQRIQRMSTLDRNITVQYFVTHTANIIICWQAFYLIHNQVSTQFRILVSYIARARLLHM